jgi:hypothetical protein
MLQAWAATQATLRLYQDIRCLGQRIAILLQIDTRTQQRVKLARREVRCEVNETGHQFLTETKV